MTIGGSGKSIVVQQYEQLEYELAHLQQTRKWKILTAAIPTIGWTAWAMLGAVAVGQGFGAILEFIFAAGVIVLMFLPGKLFANLGLAAAFMYALAGFTLPMIFGGWVIVGFVLVALVVSGIGACYTLLNNDIQLSRVEERMEELAPKLGPRPKR